MGGSYEIGFNIQPYEGAKFSIPIEVISDLLDTESVYTHNRESLYLVSKDSAKYKLCLKHLNVKKNTVDQSLHGVGIEAILLSRENGMD